jgi:hypothetical protein
MTRDLPSESRTRAEKPAGTEPRGLRRAAVFALLAVLVGGSIVATVRDDSYGEELWPFSAYPMYSHVIRTWSVSSHRLFGVLRDDPGRELPLVGGDYLSPIGHTSFYIGLTRIERMRDRAKLEVALRDTLSRYEARRRAGLHDGPPLQAIRLYELRWRLDPRHAPRDVPDSRRLLLEVASSR